MSKQSLNANNNHKNNKSSMSLIAVFITLIVCTILGGSQVATKFAMQGFTPLFCGALAFSLTGVSLWLYACYSQIDLRPPSQEVWRLHGISAILLLLFNIVILLGINLTLASRAEIFIASHPFFIVIFNSVFFKKERLELGKIIGLVLAFLGIVIVFSDRLIAQISANLLGDILFILAAAFLALTILHMRTVTHHVSSLQATLWAIIFSLPVYWLSALIFEFPLTLPQLPQSWLGLIYVGLGINALAFSVRAELFRRYHTHTISSFLLLSPIIALGLAHVLLGDPLNMIISLGAIFVCLGVFIVYCYQ